MYNNQTSINQPEQSNPIEYLIVGHLTKDLTASGSRLGGTAAFSGLTAKALGLKTGIISSFADDLDTNPIADLWLKNKTSTHTTTFRNLSDGVNRTQYLYKTASRLEKEDIPEFFVPPLIVHLGPVADEVEPDILACFPQSLKCLTPQGWFRSKNSNNQVVLDRWVDYEEILPQADAVVISFDDVGKNEEIIAKMAGLTPVFVVTENFKGARVYWHNDAHFIRAPEVKYVDDTGAGDIFASAFFYRYLSTRDPWEAGRFAVLLASWSVTRAHLDSIPNKSEIDKAKLELIGY